MREYLLVFLVAAAAAYLLTVVARELALRTGALAGVRDRDVHDEPIPYLGGVAMLGGMWAAYVVGHELPFLTRGGEDVFSQARAVLIAGSLICLLGVLDDIFELDALTKLGGQIVAASVMVLLGVQYLFLPLPNGGSLSLDPLQGNLLTVLFVVGTINAVNFVDGLDGLAAGVVGIGAIAFLWFCYSLANVNGQSLAITGALLCAGIAGACAGFLVHNWNPARIFMGDSGSMLLGLTLSGATISLTGQFPVGDVVKGASGQASFLPTLLPLLLNISILVVPLIDMGLAIVRRTKEGRSPLSADKKHLHHRLLEIGHSQRRAVTIMWAWTAVIAFGTVFASLYAGIVVLVGLTVMVVGTVFLTFLVPVFRPHKSLN